MNPACTKEGRQYWQKQYLSKVELTTAKHLDTLDSAIRGQYPHAAPTAQMDSELYALTANLTSSTAYSIVLGSSGGGLEAWRRLHDEYAVNTKRTRCLI